MADDQFSKMAGAVARELLGEPNKQLSTQKELRFGNKGSMAVDLEKGTFFDHSEGEGGGVLWFIEREQGKKGKDAVEWLRGRGFDVEDRAPPPHQGDYDQGGPAPTGNNEPRFRPVAEWDYKDSTGKLLFQVVRMENGLMGDDGKPQKSYRQRRPDASVQSGWNWKTKGLEMVPYRLPEMLEAIKNGETIFVVEGEKAADRLVAEGVPATTNPRGAGNWAHDLDKHFAGAQIVVIPDNDPQATVKKTGKPRFHDDGRPVLPGQDHAKAVATRLMDIAKDVKHLELPGLPLKGDVVDWLDGGGSIDQLYDLVDELGPYEPEPFQSSFHAVTWSGMDDPGPEHEWLVKNTLTRKEISMVAGESKAGKSFLVLDLALSVAQGIQWFGKRTMKGGVIYQAGEGATGIKKRIRAYREEYNLTTKDDLPFVLLPSRLDLYNSDDHTEALIDEINQWKKRFKVPLELIVIDTWATATPGANENDGKDVSIVLDRCAKINKATDAAVLLVHHMNSGGAKVRGHTSILANLENVLIVKQVEDHHDENNRQIREAVLDKNKDGEGGQSFRFVLKGVRIGTDEDGDAVTSCVVKMPDGAASDAQPVERPNVTNSEATLLRAIEKALDESGSAPPSNSGLPSGAESVIELKLVAAAYDTLTFDNLGAENETDEERAKRMQNRRKVMSRCCESLMRKGIIGRSNPWIWLSGRRVKGYRPTGTEVPSAADGPPPTGPDDVQQPDGWWLADDFSN